MYTYSVLKHINSKCIHCNIFCIDFDIEGCRQCTKHIFIFKYSYKHVHRMQWLYIYIYREREREREREKER